MLPPSAAVGGGPGALVPGPDADPVVLAAYLVAGLVVSLVAVAVLVKIGRVVYRLSKPALGYLDRRLPVPVPTGATNRVLLTVVVLVAAVGAGYLALDAAAPYVWYGKPLPGVDVAGSGADPLVYEGDAHDLGVAASARENRSDVDGDGLPDAWERAGETPDGVALPDADPRHKDLYVQVNRGATGRALTADERATLRQIWAEMPVENPDGERGVRLHLDADPPGGAALGELAQVTEPGDAGRFYTREHLGERLCRYRQVTLGQVAVPNATVAAEAPGHAVVVDTGRRTDAGDVPWRVHAVTHGLLHTVVGPSADGSVHDASGWLASAPGPGDDHLSAAAADRLSRRGFAAPRKGSCGAGGAA